MATIQGDCQDQSLLQVVPSQISPGNCSTGSCSPQQALPQPINGIIVSPVNVEWTPTQNATCLQNIGVTNLSDWLTWVEKNVISSYCSVKSASCQIGVSQASAAGGIEVVGKTVGKAIADCIGLTELKPHVIYDAATDSAIAGLIETPTPSCPEFLTAIQTCPSIANDGATPTHIIGYVGDGTAANNLIAKRYKVSINQPSRFFGVLPLGDASNNFENIGVDKRLQPQSMFTKYNDQGDDNNSPGSAMSYRIGTDGFYDISTSVMINTIYQPLNGWVLTHMMGILVTRGGGVGGAEEYRLDEKPLYLSKQAPAGQDVTLTGSIQLYLEDGDSIVVQVWHNDTVGPVGQGRVVQKYLNKSAETHLSIIRRAESVVTISG